MTAARPRAGGRERRSWDGSSLPEHFDKEAVVAAASRYVDLGPGDVRISSPRTGRFNTTYLLAGSSREAVIRVAPPDDAGFLFYETNMMAQEPTVHQIVLARTDVPAPRILGYDTTRDILPRDYLVLERMPGVPLSEAGGASVADVWRQVGAFLAQVHAVHGESYGYDGPHKVMRPRTRWDEAFHVMWNKLIGDIVDCDGYTSAEADLMRRLLDRSMPFIDRGAPASLLHMDVWRENVLVDAAGRVTGLLDWDRALWGDPEIEFAVLDYCGVSVPAFWEGYAKQRDNSPRAKLRRVLYLLYEIQKYIVISRARRHNPAAAEPYRREALRLATALLNGAGG